MTTPAHLYTLEEVARHLGLSVRTIKRFVASGKLQVLQFGRTMRVSEEEFARFMREGTGPQKPHTEDRAQKFDRRKMIFELASNPSPPSKKGRGPAK